MVNTVEAPGQMVRSPEIVGVSAGTSMTEKLSWLSQPLASVAKTVKIPGSVTVIVAVFAPLDQL